MNLAKTLVIGNSGSGKSWLAERLAVLQGGTWIDLDLFNWESGGYDLARKREDVIAMARAAADAERWVIEGIYGWIVSEILPAATALVWLGIDESECVANVQRRGMRRGASAQSFESLLEWAKTYRSRSGSSSYSAHAAIFHTFTRDKVRLTTTDQVTAFARDAARPHRVEHGR
ncbi:adenylate kinase [Robbsia sp. Bb-Pol-6]|uniref:Adenylate kinase n=1 Tax=Robbsia betulipollinis TaxID=2981849 RepID=A0ABT3ZL85_9BURK|nr:adenylate kinase [Robbsia betulipollinis]MCY0386703.1 adenylate kinase [Robbsia betulipollinis]